MIEQVDERLKEWVKSVLKDVNVSLGAPDLTRGKRTVRVYLMEIIQGQVPRGTKRPPLQFTLRYLVTADDSDDEVAHSLLGELLLAAVDAPDFEVEPEPVPIAVWSALGMAPRPSFVVRAPVRIERPQPKIKRVSIPLILKTGSMLPLEGVVLGPGDFPLSEARVEVPALQLRTHTDYKGRFRFPAVPAGQPDMMVRISAKGREVTVSTVSNDRRNGEPLVVRIESMED